MVVVRPGNRGAVAEVEDKSAWGEVEKAAVAQARSEFANKLTDPARANPKVEE